MKNKLIVSTSTAFCGLIAANVCWAGVTLPSNVRDVADMLQYSAQEQQKKAFATAETKAGVEKIEQEIAALENTEVEVEVYNNTLRQQLHSCVNSWPMQTLSIIEKRTGYRRYNNGKRTSKAKIMS